MARDTRYLAPIALALHALAPLPLPALAQQLVLEEVIVTARRRAETLQETPVAVTALDTEALRESGVRNLSDLNTLVPNIDVHNANGNAPIASVYIRGVGQRNTGANIDSGVGIYIDDVYIGRPDGALLDVNDVQSVQILRGPQGTLFGKNTTAGALVFTLNKPEQEFEASLGLRVGNYDRLDGDLMLNLPLTDTLWTRLSGTHRGRDGYVDNRFDGRDYMNEDRQSLIWQTRWLPSEHLTLDLNLNWAETEQRGRPQKCVPVPEYQGWQAVLFNTLGVVPSTGRTIDDFCEDAARVGDDNTVISDLGGDYESTNKGASLTVEWLLGANAALKSISAWRYTEALQNDELDHIGIPLLHRTQKVHPSWGDTSETDQYSQEFKLSGSAFDDRMQYVAGLYWYSEETDNGGNLSYLGPFDPGISNLFFLNLNGREKKADNEAAAVFVQGEWAFSDHWRLTLGARYTAEKRDMEMDLYTPVPSTLDASGGSVLLIDGGLYVVQRPGFIYNPDFELAFSQTVQNDIDNSDVTPMASLQYLLDGNRWIDTGSVYLTYAEGFLSGGLSEAPGDDLEEFKPEEVQSWELGFKLDLLDRRLRLNGALFYTDYSDRQLTTLVINQESGSPSPATVNARASTISGLELETTWLATPQLLFTFNMALSDGEIEEFDDVQLTLAAPGTVPSDCVRTDLTVVQVDSCPKDRSSENLPRLPKESYLLAAQYQWETRYGLFTSRLQGSWKFDIDYCFDSASCDYGILFEDRQFTLDARLGWDSQDERWSAGLYGTNLTDEEFITGGTALLESSGVGGIGSSPPRMYGAELLYRF